MGQELVIVHAGSGRAPAPSGRSVRGTGPAEPGLDGHALLSKSVHGLEGRHPGLAILKILDFERAPAEALLDASTRARLLVMGCKGRGGARVLVGSVAQHVLLNVQCPTLITRPVVQT